MDYSPKKTYFLIGSLILAVLILVLVVFFAREGSQTDNGKTMMVSTCPEQITYQGVVFRAKEIGEQCWMVENLKAFSYRDGSAIPNLPASADWDGDEEGAYACYNNQISRCDNYGALYNWYAVNNEKGLCPEGWSLPTYQQWVELERAICQNLGYEDCQEKFPLEIVSGWRGTDEGLHLRAVDLEGKDSYGFKALFGGFRNTAGPYSFLDEKGFWWTSTSSEDFAFVRVMDGVQQGIRSVESSRSSGFSVRCVMD